jgi:hypothetical protein
MKQVAILYGTNEGPALTWRLRPVLQANGYELTEDMTKAEYILTHSGGVLLLPRDLSDKTVLVGVPSTGYSGSLAGAMVTKVTQDIVYSLQHKQMAFWLRKTAINLFYAFNIARTFKLYLLNKRLVDSLPACEAKNVAVLVQTKDPWSQDLSPNAVTSHPTYIFATIAGHHDDLWSHPEPYIKLLTLIGKQ